MMFSVQAKAVGKYRQGAVVGLRQTMNRLAAIVIPPIMGAIAAQMASNPSGETRCTIGPAKNRSTNMMAEV